jgi:phosphatidylethanolamine N-methyltransferase
MAAVAGDAAPIADSQLRERPTVKSMRIDNVDEARQRVLELNEEEESKQDQEKRTYGRTPDGTGKSVTAAPVDQLCPS